MATFEKVDANTIKIKQVVDGVPVEANHTFEVVSSILDLFTSRYNAMATEPDFSGKTERLGDINLYVQKWQSVITEAGKLGVKASK